MVSPGRIQRIVTTVGEAGRHPQCTVHAMTKEWVKTAHKMFAILIIHSNLKKCLQLPFVPILKYNSLFFKCVAKYWENSALSNKELKKKSREDSFALLCKFTTPKSMTLYTSSPKHHWDIIKGKHGLTSLQPLPPLQQVARPL